MLPKAGPKYRLGKYFDTIYEVPEFDAIKEPEGGYLSCWDTDTDINSDDEGNNFLFANIDGDSASVICVDDDEAIELLKRWKAKEKGDSTTKFTDKESLTKPGSDGTYEIVDREEIPTDEHIYESIEDCVPEYQLFIGTENTSPLNTPTHVTVSQRQVSRKSSSPVSKSKRSNSLPISNSSSPKFLRKYSDCSEYTRLRRRQNTATDSRPAPPLPPPNNNGILSALVSTTSGEYAQLFRVPSGKVSPSNENSSKEISPPPMILKHKGTSYVLPITEKGKVGKDKVKRQSSQTTPKHVPSSTSSNNLHPQLSFDSQLTTHTYSVPRSVSMGFQAPSKNLPGSVGVETTPRRKSKHNSSHSSHHSGTTTTQASKSHVTLYGVL